MAYVYKGIDRSAPMARTAAFPLDEKSYFESLSEAQAAAATAKDAGDTTTVYYYGQIVTVTLAGVPTVYKIQKKTVEYYSIATDTVTRKVAKPLVLGDHKIDATDGSYYEFSDDLSTTVALNNKDGSAVGVIRDASGTIIGLEDGPTTTVSTDSSVIGVLVSLETAGEVGEKVLEQAQAYTDSEIQKLDVTDTAETGKFVTAVSETDGKITVSRAALTSSDLPEVPLEKLVNTGTMEKIPAAFLPSFVDDVIEMVVTDTAPSSPAVGQYYYAPTSKKLYVCEVAGNWKEATPETGKVYVDTNTNITYRWGGSAMVKIASDLALGETESTAYRGDRGKTAYDHASETKAGETTSGFYKIAVTAQGHVASTTAVEASDIPVTAFQFADGTNKFTVTKPDGTTQDVNVTPSIADATTTTSGLMSSTDKTKVDAIAEGATKVEGSSTNGNIKINGTETTVYTHPTSSAVDAAAVKVGKDVNGHVVLGDSLSKSDVGLGNVNNTSITVSATDGVTDSTNNVTYKYVHPTTEETASAAVKVGKDAQGHVVLGSALTKEDVGLGNVANQTITVTETSVSDGTNTFNKYVHPTDTATEAAAVKIGKDGTGHVVIGSALTKSDVGLDKVANQTITVTSTSVSDGTNTFDKYVHPTKTATDAAAVKVGMDGTGHVVIGNALTSQDVGTSVTTDSTTKSTTITATKTDGTSTSFTHPDGLAGVTAAAVKVGSDSKGHVVLGGALTASDVGVSATTTSVTVGETTFNQYVHPTTTAVDAAAVKVGMDGTGHVVLGGALATGDISGLSDELGKKQDNLGFTGTYSKTDNPVALKDYVDTVNTSLTTLKDVQTTGATNVVSSVTVDASGKLSVTKGSVTESDLDNALSTKINNATSALHFIGVKTALPDATKQKSGDVVLVGNKEYVCYTDETANPPVNKWAELGDESIYLTKTDASTTYETIANCNTIRGRLDTLEGVTHSHDNKTTLDAITADVKTGYDDIVTKGKGIAAGATKVVDGDTNGTIKVTKSVDGLESTDVITVYDDTTVKADIAANEASITALSGSKANKVTVDTNSASASLLKVQVNSEGIVSGTKEVTKADLVDVIDYATSTTNGIMTSTQASKLDGIATGAQVNVVEGAKDKDGTAFTIENKMIVIDNLILDGGSATSTIS